MEKELREIYKLAADYMQDKDVNDYDIIQKAADAYVKYGNELPDALIPTFYECFELTNFCGDDDVLELKGIVNLSNSLVEDLSGYLGEYFND